eukprot:5795492-Pleurochrysis_carterae.AAC.1
MSARRGGGKSVATASLLNDYTRRRYFDFVLLCTPTYASNKSIWDIAGIKAEHVIEPSTGCVARITDFVENEKREWDDYLEKKKKYAEMQKRLREAAPLEDDEDALLLYDSLGLLDGRPPKWKLPEERPARVCAVLDDLMSLPVMARPSEGL